MRCPASIKACEPYENKGNDASRYGTAAHALAELCLTGEVNDPSAKLGEVIEGVVVDKEMADGVQDYLDYSNNIAKAVEIDMIEEKVDFSHVVPEGFGTADRIMVKGDTLYVVDLKFGHNIVNAERNSQLMLYAIGALKELEFMLDDIKHVELHIAQPRPGHFDMWETTVDDLVEWSKWVSERAQLALSDNAPFEPSTESCKWCLHSANCTALYEHVHGIITGEFDDLNMAVEHVEKIGNDQIKKVLDNADLIKSFLDAVGNIALERMQSGEKIDGYKLVESRKHKAWTDADKAGEILKQNGYDEDDIFTKKIITPTQALKLVGKKKQDILDDLWSTPKGLPVLAPVSDKRPEINAAIDEFENLEG